MARKQLIKGANAARVEERIARVPADLDAAPTVFSLIKAMEVEGAGKQGPAPDAARARARPAPRPRPAARAEPPAPAARVPEAAPSPRPPEKKARLGPSDFSAAEREAIVRSCTEYRNRLPIYLRSAKREAAVIDSVLAKCGGKALKPRPEGD